MELSNPRDNGTHSSRIGWEPIEAQNIILNRLIYLESKVPVSERRFYSNGEFMAGALNLSVSFLCWRAGFRGFNLSKYDKSRTPSLVLTAIASLNGGLIYTMLCKNAITEYFRTENMYKYGFLSVLSHNIGLLVSVPTAFVFTFMQAQRQGMILVPDKFTTKEVRPLVYKELRTRLGRYTKTILIAYAISNVAMFYVGCRSYTESKHLLHLLGRKTFSMNESPDSAS